jgi:hypothetical protein
MCFGTVGAQNEENRAETSRGYAEYYYFQPRTQHLAHYN